MHAKSRQSCLTLCNPMDCSLPGSSVHEIFQARILAWLPFPTTGDLLDPGIETVPLASPALAGGLYYWCHLGSPVQVSKYPYIAIFLCSIHISISSIQFSHSVVSDSWQPHELQHARPPFPSPTPRVYSNSCPSSR